MKRVKTIALVTLAVAIAVGAQASETGHFSPGLMNIRDYLVPPPGFYFVAYNYLYNSGQINDKNGDKIDRVTIGKPPLTTTLDVDVDLDLYVLTPALMWAPNWKFHGMKYGAFVGFPLANTSFGASLATQTGAGWSSDQSQFGLADMFVEPVWLGYAKTHWEGTLAYGFYAPIGQYSTTTVEFPTIGSIKVEAADNIGLGFWTHQIQTAQTWYPWEDKRMAAVGALTWEIHGKKEGFDLTPGQNLTLNWGVSEYLPLTKDESIVLDIGPAGYDSWQVTNDSGEDARNPSVRDGVHGVGVQIGSIFVPVNGFATFRYIYEYAAKDRFRGQSFGFNLGIRF